MRHCAECGRDVSEESAAAAPQGAKLVCDSHVVADGLLARRRSSTLRMLAQKHGYVALVPAAPTVEAER